MRFHVAGSTILRRVKSGQKGLSNTVEMSLTPFSWVLLDGPMPDSRMETWLADKPFSDLDQAWSCMPMSGQSNFIPVSLTRCMVFTSKSGTQIW